MDPLRRPPIGFAHRGARAHAPDNTLESFVLARRLGAAGLETDVWLTADGVVVLDHDGVVKSGVRRRRIADMSRAAPPSHVPTLEDLYAADQKYLTQFVGDFQSSLPAARVIKMFGATHNIFISNQADVLFEMRSFMSRLR